MRITASLLVLHTAAAMGDKFTNPRAVLFDFDGSLAQSEEAHRKRFVAATGVACDSARWDAECVGRNTEWIVCHLLGVDEPPAAAAPGAPEADPGRGVPATQDAP